MNCDDCLLLRYDVCLVKIFAESVVSNELVEGVPLLLLANKCDLLPHKNNNTQPASASSIKTAAAAIPPHQTRQSDNELMDENLMEIQSVFNQIASTLGARDSKVMSISALTGYVLDNIMCHC